MAEPIQHLFTAAQIARGAGVSKDAVKKALGGIAPAGQMLVDGQLAKGYPVGQLPEGLQAKLAARVAAERWRSVEALLAGAEPRWTPAVPVGECAASAVQRACSLREAMAKPLAMWHDAQAQRQAWTGADIEAAGMDEYKRVSGHAVTAEWWWKLFDRTLARVRSGWDSGRTEVYLDENPERLANAAPKALGEASENGWLARLHQAIKLVPSTVALTDDQARPVWLAALECYAAKVELGAPARTVKEAIFDFIGEHVPGLAGSRTAVRMAFNRRLARWQGSEFDAGALKDLRIEANWSRAKEISEDDWVKLAGTCVFECGGRISQGVRQCLNQGVLSEGLASRIIVNPANKSYVPTWLRDRLKHEVRMLLDEHYRPKNTRDNGAWVERYWGCVPALDWWCADDCTLPVYFYVPDGKGWHTLMRGQFLLMIDTRSTAALGYSLMPERNYNARVIRTLITHCCDMYGLPGKGFYFERGIWKNSKILKGCEGETALGWDQAEQGLREFGLSFIHAIRARSKPVERVLGALQNLMEGDPGYAGRDERRDGIEAFERLKLAVESRRIDPVGKFYTMEQWKARLKEICEKYNNERQQGKHTGGLSPAEALSKYRPEAPPVRFDANIRYLLANHKRPVRVGPNGITLHFGKHPFNYRNERTGALRGQTVLAWFDPEEPDILTVTDMDRRNPFCVERSQAVPAMPGYVDDGDELLGQELQRAGDHMKYATTLYQVLNPAYKAEFRRNLVSLRINETGRQIEAGRAAIKTRKRETADGQREVGRVAAEAEAVLGDNPGTRALVSMAAKNGRGEGLRMMMEARKEAKEAEGAKS